MQADYTSAFSRFPEDVKAEQTRYELYLADSIVLTFDTATHICKLSRFLRVWVYVNSLRTI